MRSVFIQVVLTGAVFVLGSACSSDRGNPKEPLNPPPAMDAAASPTDTGPVAMDTGMMLMADTGMMSMVDTGLPLGPACMELDACCDVAPPQLQQQCRARVQANIETDCQSTLEMAQGFGFCLPPGHDAGMRGDVGPLGPQCEAYLACCPELGQLQMNCENTALDGVEADCDMALMLARQFGRCQMPPDSGLMSDAGTSTASMDAGTSTASMDAGTSSVADAG
jgi:hypothetical protein